MKKVELTENQFKVIKDKYLKDASSPEVWLEGIAKNIALADLLYDPDVREDEVFKNVLFRKGAFEHYDDELTTTYFLHDSIHDYSKRSENFKKFIENLKVIAQKPEHLEKINKTMEEFYNMMASFEFLPNSPTLMNAGRDLQQLSGCFVLPVGDSIDEIYGALKNMALVHKSGGGTGFSFSRLRPTNDKVITTKGISSGPISFMSMFDKSTEVVKQGGTRRGANMGIMRVDHPNIMDFINCKKKAGFLENFNISVAITEEFMRKVEADEEYDLINPRTKEVVKKLNAREVWESMVKGAWETGDPGFVIIDRINNSDSNPTPAYGEIESTNPCGEQPLLPFESCNLGSINLSKFVNENIKDFDYDKLRKCVNTAVHFLDNVIDMNNYPLIEIEKMTKGSRRIGLGVMGWAESLAIMEIPYNSERGFLKAEEVMKFIDAAALQASEEIAKKRGVFPHYKDSIYDANGKFFRGKSHKPRNAARTTIAPTGTIGIAAGLQGAGIEPFFAVAYVRYNAAGIDALKAGKKPEQKDTFFEINPLFKDIAKKYNYFGMQEADLWKRIDENHKSIIGISEIPERIQKLFLTAHDLTPMDHVRMQVAFQKYVNNAVSKTVNLKREATDKDVDEVYKSAVKLGAKGVTIYRDGSKDLQILNMSESKKEETKKEKTKRDSDFGTKSAYYCMDTGQGPLHIHVNYDEEGPISVFANITPIGTEVSGLTTALGILISKYLEMGGDAVRLLKHLNSIKGDKPFGLGPKRVDSIPHGISKVLREHLIKTTKMPGLMLTNHNIDANQTTLIKNTQGNSTGKASPDNSITNTYTQSSSGVNVSLISNLYCPKCYSSNVEIVSGCTKPTCFDCGYSECS